jgi:hypothetical protein
MPAAPLRSLPRVHLATAAQRARRDPGLIYLRDSCACGRILPSRIRCALRLIFSSLLLRSPPDSSHLTVKNKLAAGLIDYPSGRIHFLSHRFVQIPYPPSDRRGHGLIPDTNLGAPPRLFRQVYVACPVTTPQLDSRELQSNEKRALEARFCMSNPIFPEMSGFPDDS